MAAPKRKHEGVLGVPVKKARTETSSTSPASIFTEEGASRADTQTTSRSSRVRPKIYICNYTGCGKAYDRPVRLEAHIRTHTGDRAFKCQEDGCDKAFFKSEHLKAHIQNKHCEDVNHVCTYVVRINADREEQQCGKGFPSEAKLQRHLARHEKAEEIRCDECGATFRRINTLQRHIKQDHLGEDAFVCNHPILHVGPDGEEIEEECGQAFSTAKHLQTHDLREHAPNRHFCDICSPTTSNTPAGDDIDAAMAEYDRPGFRTYAALQAHKKEVHPPTCSACGKICASPRDLTAHIDIHHNASLSDRKQRFPCTYSDCDKSFTKKGNLIVHIKSIHTKTKNFVCGEFDLLKDPRAAIKAPGWSNVMGCGAAFATKATLEGHVRTQHLDLPLLRKKPDFGKMKREVEMVDSPMEVDSPPVSGSAATDQPNAIIHDSLSRLTGHAYADDRPFACPEPGCPQRFILERDIMRHWQSKHSAKPSFSDWRDDFDDEEFWVRGGRDDRLFGDDPMFSVEDYDDEDPADLDEDIDEDVEMGGSFLPPMQFTNIPVDPALFDV